MANLSGLVNGSSVLELLAREPDLALFAKDQTLRLGYVNAAFVALCGAKSANEVLGKTDRQLFPHCLAIEYERDDRIVLEEGLRREVVTLFPDGRGIPAWSRVIRTPICRSDGRIKGIVGVVRGYETARAALQGYVGIASAVESIQQNYRRPLQLAELAKSADLSVRQFERRFKTLFGATPQQYLIRIRVVTACSLLTRTDLSIAAIAERVGFSDNSGFTRHFAKVMGTTPLRYRHAWERGES